MKGRGREEIFIGPIVFVNPQEHTIQYIYLIFGLPVEASWPDCVKSAVLVSDLENVK